MAKTELLKGKITVKKSQVHNYGVFAEQEFRCGDIIEECYALFVADKEDVLYNYTFATGEEKLILPLGYGAIYNHADKPNATYNYNSELNILKVIANMTIKTGEEIYINYGKDWFSLRNLPIKKPSLIAMLRKHLLLWCRFSIVVAVCCLLVVLMQHGIIPLKFF